MSTFPSEDSTRIWGVRNQSRQPQKDSRAGKRFRIPPIHFGYVRYPLPCPLLSCQASSSSGNSSAGGSRPAPPALELLTLYHEGGVFRSLWNLLEVKSALLMLLVNPVEVRMSGGDVSHAGTRNAFCDVEA